MRMNASQAQAAYGTPRMTVGRWIASGKLAADDDGYFEEKDFKALDAIRTTHTAPGRKAAAPAVKKRRPAAKKKAAAAAAAAAKKKAPVKKQPAVKTTPKKKKAAPTPEPDAADALLPDAVRFCRESDKYTAAFLQRNFKIGHPRAARLLEAVLSEAPAKKATTHGNPALPSRTGGITGPREIPPDSRQGVDLRKALANAKKAEMEVKIKMKDLISREMVSRVFRKLYTIDSTEWRGLGPRLAPDIMAVCEVEDPSKEVEISERIEREVFRTLGHVQRVLNDFLEEIESEDRIDDE